MLNYNNRAIVFQRFKFEYIAPLNITLISIIAILTILRSYFLRSSSIVSKTKLFPKFTYLLLTKYFLYYLVIILTKEDFI